MIRPHFKDGITMGCPPMGYAMRAIGLGLRFFKYGVQGFGFLEHNMVCVCVEYWG